MAWFMLPAVCAFLAKCALLLGTRNAPWIGASWRGYVLVLLVHNAVEALMLWSVVQQWPMDALLRMYHFVSLVAVIYGVNYVMSVKSQLQLLLVAACYGGVLLMGVLVFVTDSVVFGYSVTGYFMHAERGPLFFIYRSFAVMLICLQVALLLYNYAQAERCSISRLDAGFNLVALLPLVVVSFLTAFLMKTDYAINPMMVIPIATTIFLTISMIGKRRMWLVDQPLGWVHKMRRGDLQRQLQHVMVCHKQLDEVLPMEDIAHSKKAVRLMGLIKRSASANDA